MADAKITDLVDPAAIQQLKDLNDEIIALNKTYTDVAKELAKGLEINVKVVGDLDKLENLLVEKSKQARETTEQLNNAIRTQGQIIGDTTPVISRNLMERERLNKLQREEYNDLDKVDDLLKQVNGSYNVRLMRMREVKDELKQNSKAQKDLSKTLESGTVDQATYNKEMEKLIGRERELKAEKSELNKMMTAEEKLNLAVSDSYVGKSQRLEILKKAHKAMSDEEKKSPIGVETEKAIQDLDAHLKDISADMGEFQRNVGNYAIAGQKGVVSTESLVAVLGQEATTLKDLTDQTKILEEAKTMLNTNDANYQETVDRINDKLAENKAKLTDVSDILGKEAKTVAEAEAQNKRLSEALKHIDVTAEGAKEEMERLREQISSNNDMINEATGDNEKFADSMLSLIGVNANFGSSLESLGEGGNFLEGVNTKAKALGKTLMGLIANPWVLAFLGIAGVAAGFKWWYDYNEGLEEASRLTENFTGLTGKAADKVTTDISTLADHMGKGFDETIGAANTLVQHFGISWEEAIQRVQDGIENGADMSGQLLNNIDRFGPAIADAGFKADEFVAILGDTRNGIFTEDGLEDIVKAGTRLRTMTANTKKSLDAVGLSADKMAKDLTDGTISMGDAIQQVANKIKELPENSQEAGNLIKNVFGKTAAEGGMALVESIADVNTELDKSKESMGELGKVTQEEIDAEKELHETVAALFKMQGTSFETMTTRAKTYVTKGLTSIIKACIDIANWFINIYNEAAHVRVCIGTVIAVFKTLWTVAKGLFELMINGFKNVGGILEGVMLIMSGEIEAGMSKIKSTFSSGLANLKNIVTTSGKEIGANFADSIGDAMERRLNNIEIGGNFDLGGGGAEGNVSRTPVASSGDEEDKKKSDKAKKQAEKEAKEELKRLNELEESKIALMADGHEKELALIRLAFKKKMDQIKGEGETQNALRIQLAIECEKAVADCEEKYQTALMKINLENRLASVKKGSEEELRLKLAQLAKQREEELKEAEKTGADILIIEQKFAKMAQDMREEYADKRASEIQKQYADEANDRNTQFLVECNELKRQYAEKLRLAKGSEDKIKEAEDAYTDAMALKQEQFAIETVQNEISKMRDMLEVADLSAEERYNIERELNAKVAELEDKQIDLQMKRDEMEKRRRKDKLEKMKSLISEWLNFASQALNALNDLSNTLFDSQIEKIEALQEAQEEALERDQQRTQDLLDKKVISEEEAEARKRAAEAKSAKQTEELEKKKAALKKKQAVWDKANSVAQALIATALAVVQALPNVVMAALCGALGAVQVATILATPIPAYAKGTDYHQGGPAIVGDGGKHELVILNGAAFITPDVPTLIDIPRGASVVPDVNPADLFHSSSLPVPVDSRPKVVVNNDFKRVERGLAELANLIRQQTRTQRQIAKDAEYERFKNSKM